MIPYKQLSLCDIFEDCQNIFDSDKPQFLSLLENHIDLDSIIPASFYNHYYASTGRRRKYPLTAMLWALILQKIFSIPTDSLLLAFLTYSKDIRVFCGFTKFQMPQKSLVLNRIFYLNWKIYSKNLLTLPNPYARKLIPPKLI